MGQLEAEAVDTTNSSSWQNEQRRLRETIIVGSLRAIRFTLGEGSVLRHLTYAFWGAESENRSWVTR